MLRVLIIMVRTIYPKRRADASLNVSITLAAPKGRSHSFNTGLRYPAAGIAEQNHSHHGSGSSAASLPAGLDGAAADNDLSIPSAPHGEGLPRVARLGDRRWSSRVPRPTRVEALRLGNTQAITAAASHCNFKSHCNFNRGRDFRPNHTERRAMRAHGRLTDCAMMKESR